MIILAMLLESTEPDFSKMPIEDAVQMMFMNISQDAREGTRDMLSEMQQTRQKRAAMREAERTMAKEMIRLKALGRSSGGTSPNPVVQGQIAWANQLPTICGKLSGSEREDCLAEQVNKRAVELHNLPTPK
jgi:hypothetical protein